VTASLLNRNDGTRQIGTAFRGNCNQRPLTKDKEILSFKKLFKTSDLSFLRFITLEP